MRVVLGADARADLREISAYIARDNPDRAGSFVRELRQRCAELSDMPERFPVLDDRPEGMRRCPFGNYAIFYFVERDTVLVARVLHAARDYRPLLFPED